MSANEADGSRQQLPPIEHSTQNGGEPVHHSEPKSKRGKIGYELIRAISITAAARIIIKLVAEILNDGHGT
jgi:hypothetical protein